MPQAVCVRGRVRPRVPLTSSRGASLIEALIALVLVVTMTAGVAQLIVWSRKTAWSAGVETVSVTLAAQKMEHLRSLSWDVDRAGAPVSDEATDVSREPATSEGSGLQPSPAGTLTTNTAGFVDYVDANSAWRGTGARPPAGAVFVRRWAVERLGLDAVDTFVVTVVAFPIVDAGSSALRPARGAKLTTIRTRTMQ